MELLEIPVIEEKIWGCWAGFARPTPPIYPFTTALSKGPYNKHSHCIYPMIPEKV